MRRRGGGGMEVGGRGRLYTYRYTVTTRITPALRWAAMRAILMFHNCEGQSHKTVSTDHNFWRERRAEADSNRGPSAYQHKALPLGQTGSPRKNRTSPVLYSMWCCCNQSVVQGPPFRNDEVNQTSSNSKSRNHVVYRIEIEYRNHVEYAASTHYDQDAVLTTFSWTLPTALLGWWCSRQTCWPLLWPRQVGLIAAGLTE